MLAEIGFVSTFLAFVASIYAIIAAVYGGRQHSERLVASARNAALLTFPLLLVATGALVIALIRGEYQMSYVWSVSDPNTQLFYRITALWGSQKGSILFWCFLMSLFAVGALVLNWRTHRRLMPYVIAYTMATLAFFLGLVVFYENPFERWWIVGEEAVEAALIPAGAVAPSMQRLAETANGLNPLLRHFGMIIHPPMLYLGFVAFTIPFAFAMAALASGDLSTNWIKATRRWSLVAWLFLALGLLLGGRWAYDVLGWGGYWGWDPVENAAFLPWLIGTAFLHSVMIQEKRGMLKVWNMFLIIGTFSAVIFGTFATRSGLIDSVHSFARSEIGFPMFFFWAAITVISVGLILWRWNRGELKDEHPFVNILSRESLFVLNNVVFVLLFVAIFWGSFGAPVISELFMGEDITLGQDYFLRVTPPLFVALYILMGVAPLSAWGATSLRRLGKALLVPLALTALFLVIIVVTQHTSDPGALFGYGIVSLAGFVALYETYRGASARRRSIGESWPRAVLALFTRNRRRYGGYIVHLGITIIGIGVIGSTLFQQTTQRTLAVGESVDFGGYTLRYDNFTNAIADDGRQMQIADVTLIRNGQVLTTMRPRHDIYPTQPMTIAASYSTLENDFYVLLVGWEETNANSATFKMYINPLINLVWWGGLILILGTLIGAWPTETLPVTLREPAAVNGRARAKA
ncbi:MAG: heme lyase CcmF/NrfE family subunit [Chloroflexi bacterium]|nr:heme lyase CcmF/NrfE family subunit [Chloroflexota bacterium]